MSFLAQTLLVDQQYIKLEVWDTAGQERYVCHFPHQDPFFKFLTKNHPHNNREHWCRCTTAMQLQQ